MKRNAIVRIILFSLILVILVGVLMGGLGISLYTFRIDTQSEAYALGSGEVSAGEIREIEIDWAAGNISILTADTDTITFHETGSQDAEPMVYKQQGDKLTIQYQVPKVVFGFTSTTGKDLVITVPKDWRGQKLSVNAASADLSITDLMADDVELDMASGDCHITDCDLVDLDLDCASGEVNYVGTLKTMECSAASGKITAVFYNIPTSIEFDGASADLDLTLPKDAGFTVELDTLSGDFNSEFETVRRGEQYICGNGNCKIDIDGMSGSVTIRKGDAHRPQF